MARGKRIANFTRAGFLNNLILIMNQQARGFVNIGNKNNEKAMQ